MDMQEYTVKVFVDRTEWYQDGERHRPDGPAVEWAVGSKSWWKNGKRHRPDGPAVEWADGSKSWYQDGQLHRLDGPAIEYADGSKSWYINGQKLTNQEFNALMNPCNNKIVTIDGKQYKLTAI